MGCCEGKIGEGNTGLLIEGRLYMGDGRLTQVHIALQGQFEIASEVFYAVFVMGEDGQLMLAGWKNKEDRKFSLQQAANSLHIQLPTMMNFEITMVSMDISYHLRNKTLGFQVVSKEYGSISFQKICKKQKKNYIFGWDINKQLYLHEFPIIGKYIKSDAEIVITGVKLQFAEGEDTQFEFGIKIKGLWQEEQEYLIGDCREEQKQSDEVTESSLSNLPEKASDIKWLEVKKDLGNFQFHKLGFGLQGDKIRLYLNAGFTLSILEMEFIELYFGIALQKKVSIEYGLKGLAVAVSKDPFYLSGGLYVGNNGLYSGMLTVRFQKFSMLAMASYGKLPGSSTASFFAYLAVSYPLGGIPAFYVTGLAAGFGVHRAIRLPDIHQVSTFPLVTAAMGNGMNVADAAEALEYLNDVIYPSEGNYFISAGIKFTSFGMIEAFALLNIQFGSRTEISLLGIADAALPAKVDKPIAFIRLALRFVFAPEDGFAQMSGALTSDSYILDRACRLQGGFALYTWFQGEHKGDFVLSVGGYHPNFHRSHYPSVDRVGINWIINHQLTVKGEGYFALTPNCIMAGGKLEIMYTAGKLKAWCRAFANIVIGWRPFYYDIELGVSLGASYRVDFLFIHKTFTLELGADMRIRGPEFSGYVHIKWCILSFTICFGKTNETEKKIDWNTFAETFLQSQRKNSCSNVPKLCNLNVLQGVLGQKQNNVSKKIETYYVNGRELEIEIQSQMPCSTVSFQGKEVERCSHKLGILPMKITDLQVELHVTVKCKDRVQEELLLETKVMRQDMPAALWDTSEVSLQKDMLKNLLAGIHIRTVEPKKTFLPELYTHNPQDCYLLSNLTKNHLIFSKERFGWNPKSAPEEKKEWRGKKGSELMEESIVNHPVRNQYLKELHDYGVYEPDQVDVRQFKENLRTILWAPPVIQRTGSKGGYEERNGDRNGRKN